MAIQTIAPSRLAQRTAAAKANANFAELDAKTPNVSVTATAAGTLVIPGGYYIEAIVISGNNANAVSGGIKIGTSAGGTQVVAAQPVAGNSVNFVESANILMKVFSKTANQTLHFDAVTGWTSANVTIVVSLRKAF